MKRIASVPMALKEFWMKRGYGFFIEDADGNLIDPDVANRLISPDEVIDLLTNAVDLAHEFSHGMPFFDRNDRRYLLIDKDGHIVSAEADLRTVSASFDEFLHRIVRDPVFYDDGV